MSSLASPLTEHPLFSAWNVEPVRTIAARHSSLVEYRGRRDPRHIIVKSITKSSSAEHAAGVAQWEFAAIARLHDQLSGELRDSVPQPLLWLPGTPAFAMSKLGGIPFGTLLKQQASRVSIGGHQALIAAATRIGFWLKHFHEATAQPPCEFDPGPFLFDLELQIKRSIGNGWPADRAERVLSRTRVAAREAEGRLVPLAARQGDFRVENILLDGERVHVVDFENFAETDAIYEDVCALLSYLTLLSGSPLYAANRVDAAAHAFASAYGAHLHDPVRRLYEIKLAVAVLSEFPGTAGWLKHQQFLRVQQRVEDMAEHLPVEVVRYRVGATGYQDVARYHEVRYQGRANEYKQQVMAAAYLDLVGKVAGKRVLDVGCGTGRGLVDLVAAGAHVVGSDASIDMLGEASRRVESKGSCGLAAAYAQHLPFPDHAFDLVISLNFLHLFSLETQRQMISEMKRVVKPGGRVILEFDNALNGLVVGPLKRWTGRERGSLPGEIRQVIGEDWPVRRRRGAVYPIVWRIFSRFPRIFAPIEKLAYYPGFAHLSHRLYYELATPSSPPH